MAWQIPKANWLNTDAIPHTELNKYGVDINTLHAMYTLSGSGKAWSSLTVASLDTLYVQTIAVTIPVNHSLLVHSASAYFDSTRLRLRILPQTGYGAPYTSPSNAFDVYPDFGLYSNLTAAPVFIALGAALYNASGAGVAAIDSADGWTARMTVVAL